MSPRERPLSLAAAPGWALRAVALGLVLLVPAPGQAQGALRRGDRARREARIEDASAAYLEALRGGALDRSELAHVHLRLAEIAYLGEELVEGARHLLCALSLRPDAPTDEGPVAMRDAAAEILLARSQRMVQAVIEVGDASAPVRIDLRDAPEGLVRVVEVRGAGGFSRTLAWDGTARELAAPTAARPLSIRALDAHGNLVARAGTPPPREAPPEVAPAASPDIPAEEVGAEDPDPSLLESPILWVVAGLLVVGVAVAVGVSASGERYVLGAPRAP